jgi:hypothetical protein
MRRVLTGLVLAGVLMVGASAQQVPRPPEIAAEEASMQGYGDRDTTCAAWTDGCITCRRADNGDPLCPNIGLACQPQPIRCMRKVGEPDPDAPKPEPPKPEPPKTEPPKTEPPKTEPPK